MNTIRYYDIEMDNKPLANCYIAHCRLANCHLAYCYLAYCPLFILQTVHSLFSIGPWDTDSLLVEQRCTWRAPLQLGLTIMVSLLMSERGSYFLLFFFFCMFPRVLLLTLCVSIRHMESLGQGTSYCRSCFGSGWPHYFWDHPTLGGCWFESPIHGR